MNQPSILWQHLVSLVDKVNDHFTSYRLLLYSLLAILGWSIVGSFTHQFSYSAGSIALSAAVLMGVGWGANKLFSSLWNVPANKESGLISGLILALIMTPAASLNDYLFLAGAALVAIASKYILVWRRAHVFNPAAFGAFIAGVAFNYHASWWIGTKFTTPLIAFLAIFILRKIKRYSLVAVFCAVFVLAMIWSLPAGSSTDAAHHLIWLGIISTPLLFFATIMLTEPLTSPATLNPTLIYALAVGALYSVHRLHASPEEALLLGNALTLVIAPNRRYKLSFVRKVQEAQGIMSYIFAAPRKPRFQAGQYMEWTLAQAKSDSRGNRRYLTIASSPTEDELMFTVKLPEKPSAFKQSLEALQPGDPMYASYLSGSFILPKDAQRKITLIAGGVGITPFHSMIKSLLDRHENRDISLIYSVSKPEEIAFKNLFSQASSIGLKSLSTTNLTPQLITTNLPDYKDRFFYISGPYGFVGMVEKQLLELSVHPSHIVTDYFPGYGS